MLTAESHSSAEVRSAAEIEQMLADGAREQKQRVLSGKLSLAIWGWVLIGLFPQLLYFGGVHSGVALGFQSLTCALAAVLVWKEKDSLHQRILSSGAVSTFGFKCFTALLLYVLGQGLIFQFIRTPHPVLGSAGQFSDLEAYRTALLSLISFVATVLLALRLIRANRGAGPKLITLACFSYGIAALVAITHWLYDNGKLFWMLEPNQVFASPRARWPFVNPDHLSAFLIPGLFLLLLKFQQESAGVWKMLSERRSRASLLEILSNNHKIQSKLSWLLVWFSSLVLVGLAIFAAASRAGLIAASLALLLYLVAGYIQPQSALPAPETKISDTHSEQGIGRRKRRRHSRLRFDLWADHDRFLFYIRAAAFCLAVGTIAVLFSAQGKELIQGRLEYGLVSSRDDVRWTMYADSLRMLKDHLLFGVGWGNWGSLYWSYMDPKLAGINPVYLHSDLFQTLVELGVFGILPLALLVTYLGYLALRKLLAARSGYLVELRCLLACMFASGVCAGLDFPLRIPVISFALAIQLALLIEILDEGPRSEAAP